MKLYINDLSINITGNNKNKAVIFVHGFPYNHKMWDKQIEYFNKIYECISYDVRGLGASEVGDGQYTMEKYAEDLFSIIDKLKLETPILCGLSMGGYLSYRAIEINQSAFNSVIFCDTKAQSDSDEIKLIRANKIKQINDAGLDLFIDEFLPTCFSTNYKFNCVEKYNEIKSLCKANNPIGVKGALIAMLSRTDSTHFLSKIKIPTLHLCGEFDTLTPPVLMEETASKISNSQFSIVPNSGHMSPIENPDFVNKTIENFIISNN